MTTIYLCHCGEGFRDPDERQDHLDTALPRHRHHPSGEVHISEHDALNLYGKREPK